MTKLQDHLSKTFGEILIELDKSLADLSYFKVGGPAEAFLQTSDKDLCVRVVRFCQQNNYKFTMLGGGSNIIVSDRGVSGLVINYINEDIENLGPDVEQSDTKEIVRASAGIKMAILVSKTVGMGLTGLEYFLGVPGTLGGAIYNNSHYLSDLIGENVQRVEIIDEVGQVTWLSNEECNFGYDSSRFHNTKEVILSVEFLLAKGNQEESSRKIREATEYRANTQPLGHPSSGCIFQNVPNNEKLMKLFPQFAEKSHVPGGFIIDQAGLKGTRIGGVSVSEKHAAWFINDGTATAQDVQLLVEKVKKSVREKFGINLQEEVFFLN